MFSNCRHCNALVATDPVTDLPPERCPRCSGPLRVAGAQPEPAPSAPPKSPPLRPSTPAGAGDWSAQAATRVAAALGRPVPVAPAAADDDATAQPGASTDAAAAAVASDPSRAPAQRTPAPLALSLKTHADAPAPAHASPPPARAEAPAAPAPAASVPGTAASPAPPSGPPAAPAPGFLARASSPRRATPTRPLHWWPALLTMALSVLLVLQALLADRARLAEDARWRPLLSSLCGAFGCTLPPWREPGAFVIASREVRPHPSRADALRVSASFRNDARWAQAWPHLVLTLSDVDGRRVAARAFAPGEYLPEGVPQALLEPGRQVQVSLDIHEPSRATVSYAFDFR